MKIGKWAVLLVLSLIGAALPGMARAQQDMLFCDDCTEQWQFESVAKDYATQRGYNLFAVGNRSTNTIYYVEVYHVPPGEVPMRQMGSSRSSREAVVVAPAPSHVFVAPTRKPAAPDSRRQQSTANGIPAPPEDNSAFQGILWAGNNRLMVSPLMDSNGFDSLAGAELQIVGPRMHSAMSAQNPAWTQQAVTGGLKELILMALGREGRAPIACQIFRNGDIGCFKIHPTAISAPVYIAGTGRNVHDEPIERDGYSVPNAWNIGPAAAYSAVTQTVGYSMPGGAMSGWYLSCGYIGGVLHSCHVMLSQ